MDRTAKIVIGVISVVVVIVGLAACGSDEGEVRDAIEDAYDGASVESCEFVDDDDGFKVFRCIGDGFPDFRDECYYVGEAEQLVGNSCEVARATD